MLSFIAIAALCIALVGAYALGYTPKALWLAAKAKYEAWRANFK